MRPCAHESLAQHSTLVCPQDGLVLEAPFEDASLFDTALFLRLCYQPLNRPRLATELGALPGVLLLAHKLDAPQVQAAVVAVMAGENALCNVCSGQICV